MECLMCRDKGKVGGCPKCGKILNLTEGDVSNITIKEAKRMCIPTHYLKKEWDSLILENEHEEYCDDNDFQLYISRLNECYDMIKKGTLPAVSALVASPLGYGKTTWAYNCMMQAKAHNYSVVPLIDTAQMRRMLLTATERPEWKNSLAGYSYNEYMTADLLIVCISTGPEYIYAFETIVNLVNIRSRLAKPTIFLSNYSIRELISQDNRRMLYKLLNGGGNVDPLKYLIKIEFVEYAKG